MAEGLQVQVLGESMNPKRLWKTDRSYDFRSSRRGTFAAQCQMTFSSIAVELDARRVWKCSGLSASVLKLLGSIIVWRHTKTIANRIKIRRRTGRIMPMWAPRQGDGVADSSSADASSLLFVNFIEKSNRCSLSIEIQLLKL